MDSHKLQAQLVEYKDLRSEIRAYLTQGHNNRYFAFTILIAVYGLKGSIELLNNYAFFVTSIIIGVLWFTDLLRLKDVFRIATYIEKFIERKVDGLNWETLTGLWHFNRQTQGYSKAKCLLSNIDYFVLYLCNSIYFFWLQMDTEDQVNCHVIIPTTALILFFIILVFVNCSVITNGRQKQLKKWGELTENTHR